MSCPNFCLFALDFSWEGEMSVATGKCSRLLSFPGCWQPMAFLICILLAMVLALFPMAGSTSRIAIAAPQIKLASHRLGLVDMSLLVEHHPGHSQLAAIDEQISIRARQWQEYIWLLMQQAKADGVISPLLIEMGGAANPELGRLIEEAVLWEKAKEQRVGYLDSLRQETTENLDKREAELGKDLKEQIAQLQRESQKAILDLQVELALLPLTKSEAEVRMREIARLQAQFENRADELQENTLRKLEKEILEAEATATHKAQSYEEELLLGIMSRTYRLEPGILGSTVSNSIEDHFLERFKTRDFELNTASVGSPDQELFQAKRQWENDMDALLARREKLVEEMEEDLQAELSKSLEART